MNTDPEPVISTTATPDFQEFNIHDDAEFDQFLKRFEASALMEFGPKEILFRGVMLKVRE